MKYSKKMLKAAGTLTCAGLIALTLTCCGKKPPVDHVSNHSLFNDDVKITRTETTQEYMLDDWVKAVKLEFDIEKPGNYLFEGWVANYRAQDTLGEKWEYQVEEVPYHTERNLKSLIYRLEATRVTEDKTIKRDTAKFKHHGIAGSFNVQGEPIAK